MMAAAMLPTRQEENTVIVSFPVQDNPKTVSNKKRGRKSEVYSFEIDDMKRLVAFLEENNKWIQYLAFVLSCNMARRVGDMLSLRWENFFNPATGNIRSDIMEIEEEKTGKLANPRINSACRAAIRVYMEKTGCDPSANNYQNPVFLQLDGTHKGRVLSYSGYLKCLKRAAADCGIEYNVGTHSARKTFGKVSRELHPGDHDSMELLSTIYNHSGTKVTQRYIGLTKEKTDQYYDDMGQFFNDYVTGDTEYKDVSEKPIVSLNTNDLRALMSLAYETGMKNASETNPMSHVNAMNKLISMIEDLKL